MRFIYLILSFGMLAFAQAQNTGNYLVNETTDRKEALQQIERIGKAIHNDSTNAKLYNNRAAYYVAVHEFDKADEDLQKSIQLNAKDAITWDNYGSLKSRQHNHKSAYSAYSEAIKLSPANPQFINNAGWSLCNMREYEKSIPYFDKALTLDSSLGMVYMNKGLALIGLKRNEEGCRMLQSSAYHGVANAHLYIDKYCRIDTLSKVQDVEKFLCQKWMAVYISESGSGADVPADQTMFLTFNKNGSFAQGILKKNTDRGTWKYDSKTESVMMIMNGTQTLVKLVRINSGELVMKMESKEGGMAITYKPFE